MDELLALGGTVSPHTRGWTSAIVTFTARASGFPAHAGMDPVATHDQIP